MGVNLTLMANKGSAEAGRSVYLSVVNDESKKPMELQESFLMQLIRDNENTEIGKKYGFKDIHSIQEYRDKVPVSIYDDIAPYD